MRIWLNLKYTQQTPSGMFFYRRRIPDNAKKHHQEKTHYQRSLGTKDVQAAKYISEKLTQYLDVLWDYYKDPEIDPTPAIIREIATE